MIITGNAKVARILGECIIWVFNKFGMLNFGVSILARAIIRGVFIRRSLLYVVSIEGLFIIGAVNKRGVYYRGIYYRRRLLERCLL